MHRWLLVTGWWGIMAAASLHAAPPNVVVIFCDDLGYGDLACYGHPTIATPNLDRMAAEGLRATQFYVAASVCTPSRAALMTGRLPVRTGMCGNRRVLFPDSIGGLAPSETTIAEMLRHAGYRTHMVGKWHLGHRPEYLPTSHGFETYFGIPYSNDMDSVASDDPDKKGRKRFDDPDWRDFNVPMLSGTSEDGCTVVERPVDQTTLTRRYTDRAVDHIAADDDRPFFVYLAHSLPHVPLFRSDEFVDHSIAGIYGDVIEEIDHGVGRVLDAIETRGVTDQTLVVFTSDNGPWLTFKRQGGSSGPLREGKGTTFEGGMRVPAIFRMPGTIAAGRIDAGLASTMDILPTVAAMAGVDPPASKLDGHDLTGWLSGRSDSPRHVVHFYRDTRLMAIRRDDYKAHFVTQNAYGGDTRPVRHDRPLLYDLAADAGERYDVAEQYPDVVDAMEKLRDDHQSELNPPPSQLDRR